LVWWWQSGPASFERVEWHHSEEYIILAIEGRAGQVQGRTLVNADGQAFWILATAEESSNVSAVALEAALLIAELGTYLQDGRLELEMLGPERFEMRVYVPIVASPPSVAADNATAITNAPLSRSDLEALEGHIYRRLVDSLSDVGQRLQGMAAEHVRRAERAREAGELDERVVNGIRELFFHTGKTLAVLEEWLAYGWETEPPAKVNVSQKVTELARKRPGWSVETPRDVDIVSRPQKLAYVLDWFLEEASILLGEGERAVVLAEEPESVYVSVRSGGHPVTATAWEKRTRLGDTKHVIHREFPEGVPNHPYIHHELAQDILLDYLEGGLEVSNDQGLDSFVNLHLPKAVEAG
jgi:hypothetical protein